MKNFFFPQKACWLVILFLTISVSAFAAKTGGSPYGDIIGSNCMPVNGTQLYTGMANSPDPNCSVISVHWVARGDLQIVDGADTYGVRVQSFNRNPNYNDKAYGKGRLVFYFTLGGPDCPCPREDSVYIDIYKDFEAPNPPHEIIGPQCIQQGDTVIFSYRPIVTVNVNEMIGIDTYVWDLSSVSVDYNTSPFYFAGDSSSVTFVAGNVQDGEEIRLNVGRCNQEPAKTIVFPLFKKASQPIIEDICEPLGVHSVTIEVQNPVNGIDYTWFLPPQYNTMNNTGSPITVSLDQNTSAMIVVQAALPNSTANCSSNYDTMMVYRSFDQNIAIIESKSCAAVTNNEEYVTYSVQASSSCDWQIPAGWEFKPNTDPANATVFIKPTSAAQLRDTIKVKLHSCSDTTLMRIVHVKPGKLPAITGEICVTKEQEYKYYINAAEALPVANDYAWTVPTGWGLRYGATHDTIYVTPQGNNVGNISVTPKGLDNCNGDATTFAVKFSPQLPTGISINKTCINSGMEDEIVLTAEGSGSGQQYQWFIPEELGSIDGCTNCPTATIITSGGDGSYEVGVSAYNEGCGVSDTISGTVVIQGETFTVNEMIMDTTVSIYMIPIGAMWISNHSFEWKYDGMLVNSIPPYMTIPLPNGLLDSPDFSVLVGNNVTGCFTKKTFGTSLKSATIPPAKQHMSANNISLFNMTVLPNPATTNLTVTLSGANSNSVTTLILYNSNGAVIETWNTTNISNITLDIAHISSGIYILAALQDANYTYKKILIK